MEETQLRERLESLAFRTAPPPRDPDELVTTVVARHHAHRRQEWLLAAVAAVLAAVLVVPLVVSRTEQEPRPASPAPSSAAVYTTPTRGDLSDDGAFLDGVRRLPWTTGPAGADVSEPPLETRRVVFAGHVPGGRWALVAGADPATLPPDEGVGPADLDALGSVAIAWFRGPSDASADEMTLYSVPRVVSADEPTALTDSTGYAVVVAAPDDRIEVSGVVLFEPDGTARREYEPTSAHDGVAVFHEVPIASLDRALRYRITRDGERFTGRPDSYVNPGFTLPAIDFDHLRPPPSPAPGDDAVTAAIDDLFGRTGLSAPVVRSYTVPWAGDLATRDGGSARLTVLVVELPSGTYYVTGALGYQTGSGVVSATCGSQIRPASPRVDRQFFVVSCTPGPATGDVPTNSLVVVAPPGTTTAEALHVDGRVLAQYALTDGVAIVPPPAELDAVRFRDAAGAVVGKSPPLGVPDLGD